MFKFKLERSKNPIATVFVGLAFMIVLAIGSVFALVGYFIATVCNFVANLLSLKKPFFIQNEMVGNKYKFNLKLNK